MRHDIIKNVDLCTEDHLKYKKFILQYNNGAPQDRICDIKK